MGYERKSADGGDTPITKPELTAALQKMNGEIKGMMDALGSKAEDTRRNVETQFKRYDDEAGKFSEKFIAWEAGKKAVDDKLAAIEKAASEAGTKAADLDKHLRDLEAALATRGDERKDDPRQSVEYKAAFDVLRAPLNQWQMKMHAFAEQKALRTDVGPEGGFMVPEAFDVEIRKKVTETSPMRALARKRPLPGKTLNVSVRNLLMSASFEGETKPARASNSRYGSRKITAHRQTAEVEITVDQLISTPVAMEAELASDAGEAFANNEGTLFVKGTGNGQPMGFTKAAGVEARLTANTGYITFDDVADLISDLKTGYNGILGFNRKTTGALRKIKDSMGRPLWQPVSDGKPATIYDELYTDKFIDLDSGGEAAGKGDGSGAIPIVYADWQKFYEIYDAVGMMVVRDDLTLASEAMIRYIFRRYLDGQVILADAGKLLKIK